MPKGDLFLDNTSGKFLYIRHGQTTYNSISAKDKKKLIDINLLNSGLDEIGISQAKEAKSKINSLNIKYAYCSPLARTIETAYYLLEDHPQVNDIVVKIHPLCTEIVNSSQDYIGDIQCFKEKYNMNSKVKFNWEIFDSFFPEKIDQDCYMLNFLDDIDENLKIKMIKEAKNEYSNKNMFKEKIFEFVKLARINYNRPLESLEKVWQRSIKFKKFLMETFKKSLDKTEEKVLVITHSTFINASTSKLMYSTKEKVKKYPDGKFPENCGILSVLIENA